MGRGSAKRQTQPTERRKRARSTRSSKREASAQAAGERCRFCDKGLKQADRALFVEEEVGRIFCSEACIADFFSPEVEQLEKQYFALPSSGELSGEEREKYSHLRWITLQEPDELWRERTLQGDYRFTLISEFKPDRKPVWCVCVCLFLRGEPSFLYLAFTTCLPAVVRAYRKGERVERRRVEELDGTRLETSELSGDDAEGSHEAVSLASDGLGSDWTPEEMVRAELGMMRRSDDIPESEFEQYQRCLEPTLEEPDEVWRLNLQESPGGGRSGERVRAGASGTSSAANGEVAQLYHFIKTFTAPEGEGFWYVVVARDVVGEARSSRVASEASPTDATSAAPDAQTEAAPDSVEGDTAEPDTTEADDASGEPAAQVSEEEIELVHAFPTRDPHLVEQYRRGVQELGSHQDAERAVSRLIH